MCMTVQQRAMDTIPFFVIGGICITWVIHKILFCGNHNASKLSEKDAISNSLIGHSDLCHWRAVAVGCVENEVLFFQLPFAAWVSQDHVVSLHVHDKCGQGEDNVEARVFAVQLNGFGQLLAPQLIWNGRAKWRRQGNNVCTRMEILERQVGFRMSLERHLEVTKVSG